MVQTHWRAKCCVKLQKHSWSLTSCCLKTSPWKTHVTNSHFYTHTAAVTKRWNISVTASNYALGKHPPDKLGTYIQTNAHAPFPVLKFHDPEKTHRTFSLTWQCTKIQGQRLNVSSNVTPRGTWPQVIDNHSTWLTRDSGSCHGGAQEGGGLPCEPSGHCEVSFDGPAAPYAKSWEVMTSLVHLWPAGLKQKMNQGMEVEAEMCLFFLAASQWIWEGVYMSNVPVWGE